MRRFRVFVKGTPDQLVRACLERPVCVLDYRYDGSSGCTVALVEADWTTVQSWFLDCSSDAPFPEGSLLYYREVGGHDDQDR